MADLKIPDAAMPGSNSSPHPMPMEDTLGPYFPARFTHVFAADCASPQPRASDLSLEISGTIRDMNGAPVTAVVVESWHPLRGGSDRIVRDGDFQASDYTRQYSVDGRYVIRTAWPAAEPLGGGRQRAPYLTLFLFCDGVSRLATQIFFEGHPLNEADPLLTSVPPGRRARLTAKRVGGSGTACYELDLVLRGHCETPFFDDHAAREPMGAIYQERRLQVGQTDRTSAERTPMHALRRIPHVVMSSFIPRIPVPAAPMPAEADLTRLCPGSSRAAGQAIAVAGCVTDEDGRPQRNVLLEIWNANSFGRYDHPGDPARAPLDPLFSGAGRAMTDEQGRYRFLTIRPAAYLARPDIDRWRPAHVHLSLLGGSSRLVTQMYFPTDRFLMGDPGFQLLGAAGSRHVAIPTTDVPPDVDASFVFDICVRGRGQTRFEE